MQSQCSTGMSCAEPNTLVAWYKQYRRALPWRKTKDPYRILVSETMLQQTRVETVIPYYRAFLERFPSVFALAKANEADVLKMWQGLGYYSRARNLQRLAQEVVDRHEGRIPNDESRLCELPGVGEYTCGAVMSIAFDAPVPAVDGNVLRVMTRYLGIHLPIDKSSVRRQVRDVVAAWLQHVSPALLTQALMELGALVCVPRNPKCTDCPLREGCVAKRDSLTDVLPVKPKKKPRKLVDVFALWLETEQGVLVKQRPNEGLLAGLWQLPAAERDTGEYEDSSAEIGRILDILMKELTYGSGTFEAVAEQAASYGASHSDPIGAQNELWDADATPQLGEVMIGEERHIFSHIEWRVRVYRPISMNKACRIALASCIMGDTGPYRWVPRDELGKLAWPRVYEKLLSSLTGLPI